MKVLGKVLWGVACIMALQGTGWSSNETLSTEFVEANRHPGKLFEEPLGQRGLNELLTAFSEEEVAKMRSVPEEEPCYRASLWIGIMVEQFAEAKGISWKSLARLANRLESGGGTGFQRSALKELVDDLEGAFQGATLDQRCCLLHGIHQRLGAVCNSCERKWRGEEPERSTSYREDIESLMNELDYRYAMHFLETLLYLS